MGPRFVPVAVVASLLGFVGAAFAAGLAPGQATLWQAAVGLVVIGGITPLIYVVNLRVVPVFARRMWPSPRPLYAAAVASIAGGWLIFAGRAVGSSLVDTAGDLLALAGGLFFMVAIVRLFRSPVTAKVAAPLPFPEQAVVDRIGTRFTSLAGVFLLVGLAVGVMLDFWVPARGRWDLVWAHTMLLGWFLTMAAGVCYHVMPRWTDGRWRHPALIRAHLVLVELGLPIMLVALALDVSWLFLVAGPLQAAALLLFLANIVPLARRLPRVPRIGVTAAASFLALGVLVGASMAIDPVHHVTMRFSHAEINLFGWAGLLVSGVGTYLFPRFAGRPLRWPRLAIAQVIVQSTGVVVGAVAWWWYLSVDPAAGTWVTVGNLLAALGLAIFTTIVWATFRARRPSAVSSTITLQPGRRRPVP